MKIEIDWPEVLAVSHSRLKTWRRCQMQHHYRYYQKLRRIGKSVPLAVGSAVHSMIESQHEQGDWVPALKEFRTEYEKLFREEKQLLGDLPGHCDDIVRRYFETYREDGLVYPKRRRNRSTELEVRVNLDATTQFLGFIDAYPQDGQGRNWLMDHKTCKSIPDEDARFADLQLVTYNWLLPQLDYPEPDGVIWDYIRTKPPSRPEKLKAGGFSKSAKIDTTYEVYMDTIISELGEEARGDYEEFARTLVGKEDRFFRRIYLPNPPKAMVNTVVEDIKSSIREIKHLGPKATTRSMSRDCKQCSYYNLCQAEVRGLDTEYIRKTEFTTTLEKINVEEANGTGDSADEE